MKKTIKCVLVGTTALLVLGSAAFAAEQATNKPADPVASCAQMMQGAGVTDEGNKAMHEFMQSPRAPEAMTSMMAMARRMGNGDVMLGMTRMMEMMGSMGGQSGMMPPGGRQPAK